MFDFILNCILWSFAIYGVIDIVKSIKSCWIHKRIENNGLFIIIATKNQEFQIEGFMRSVIFKVLYGKNEFIRRIVVTDLSSQDNTKEILKKLSEDYQEIKYEDWEVCKKKLDKYNIEL